MSMLKKKMLIWKSLRREGREDEGIQIMFQPTKMIAILIGFDLVAMYNQGCISCGILVSGIRARGVSSEHMENMEMVSCSPT